MPDRYMYKIRLYVYICDDVKYEDFHKVYVQYLNTNTLTIIDIDRSNIAQNTLCLFLDPLKEIFKP